MQNRQERLAALNGESRVFVCADCGRVKHIKDAGARVGRTANIVCMPCIMGREIQRRVGEHVRWLFGKRLSPAESMVMARTRPYPVERKVAIISTPRRVKSNHYERLFLDPPIWEKDCNAQWRDQQYKK